MTTKFKMFATVYRTIATGYALSLIAGLSGCGKEENNDDGGNSAQGREQSIKSAAREHDIPEQLMLAAAYSQTHFGLRNSQPNLNLVDGSQNVFFNMDESADAPQDMYESAKRFAARVKENAEKTSSIPKNDQIFDWIYLIADSIVGKQPEACAKDLKAEGCAYDTADARKMGRHLVMSELFHTYNNGYLASIDGKVSLMEKQEASKVFRESKLSPTQRQRFSKQVLNNEVLSNLNAEVPRAGKGPLKVVIRWCPGSAFQCYQQARKSSENSAHFLLYHSIDDGLDHIKLHDVKNDLRWNEKVANDTITFMLTGLAGTSPETLNPEWYDWNDYARLWGYISGSFPELTSAEQIVKNTYFSIPGRTLPAELVSDNKDAPTYDLPVAFDAPLMEEILQRGYPISFSEITAEAPKYGESIGGKKVNWRVYLQPGTRSVQIVRDDARAFASDGTRIIQSNNSLQAGIWNTRDASLDEVDAELWKAEKIYTFQGSTRDSIVSFKIICRDENRNLLTSKIHRFVMPALKANP